MPCAAATTFKDGERKIEAFLTHLAVDRGLSPSTQNQAMNAVVFLYKQVLDTRLYQAVNAERAPKRATIPVVMKKVLESGHGCV